MAKSDPVAVVGAGPVGLCLALALAQQDVPVVLIEALSDDNFLDQVPRGPREPEGEERGEVGAVGALELQDQVARRIVIDHRGAGPAPGAH